MAFKGSYSRERNNTADYVSRLLNENTEWRLISMNLKIAVTHFTSNHIINLFASCFDYLISKSVSWSPMVDSGEVTGVTSHPLKGLENNCALVRRKSFSC